MGLFLSQQVMLVAVLSLVSLAYLSIVFCTKKIAAGGSNSAKQTGTPVLDTKSKSKETTDNTFSREDPKSLPREVSTKAPDDNRTKWALDVVEKTNREISEEFRTFKKLVPSNLSYNCSKENDIKNRYADVWCWDHTRVILRDRKNDYIHASWIDVPDKSTRYICTQGPLPETQEDFWHMVFQEKTKFVVMLCNLIEHGEDKCVLYYPEKKGETVTHGDYKITNVEIKPEPIEGCKWSILDVHHQNQTFQVYHVFVTWWPDQLAPADGIPMVNLYKWIKSLNDKDSPILVHCSAGVGRTSTFVGIDYANIRIQENAQTHLLDVVKEMRTQRYQAFQSHIQYLYLHVCLLEYFIQEGLIIREEKVETFLQTYKAHATRKIRKKTASHEVMVTKTNPTVETH